MTTSSRLLSRALITTGATTTLLIGSWAGIATASAHVHVDAENPVRGSSSIVTFQVPNESETGSPTTQITVILPTGSSATTDVMPGWTTRIDKDLAAGTVKSVTWTAVPGAGIPADQFELFELEVGLPDSDTASFPATQTYADGTVVRWDQPTPPGGAEPDHPAPTLTLVSASEAPADHHATPNAGTAPAAPPPPATAEEPKLGPDNIARALAGGALLVGALGVGIALVRRRA